ncbi:MAG: FAD/NAD(P)-binding protein [Anditalea sp.]
MKNITIIGGGACGVAVYIELLLQITTLGLTKEVKLTVIEKDDRIGYGLAFGTDQPGHLLNTQADLMGIHAAEPGHFSDWLKTHGGKARKDVKGKGSTDHTYTTRKLYGDYVAEQANFYIKKAWEKGVNLDVIHAEAIDLHRDGDAYEVICHDGCRIPADFIVLALGTPKPKNYPELCEYPQYIDFPWPSERIIQKINTDDHVGILGSSLSAIDAIMTLVDNGHSGKISLFSPDGILPRVQPEENQSYKRKFLTIRNIHKIKRESFRNPGIKLIFSMFQQEVEDYYGKPIDWKGVNRTGKPSRPLLNWDISCAEKGGDAIMSVIYSLRYDASDMWSLLSIDEKERFKKWLSAYWMINRHAMPLYNAYRLQSLFNEEKLEVFPEFLEVDFEKRSEKFTMRLGNSENRLVDKLINSTGSSSHLGQMGRTLIDNMMKKEYLSGYPIGGALINERTMQVVSPKGGEGIYALGHIVNGLLLDVNAVWFNVRTAATLSKDIIFKIKNGRFS